MTSIFGGSQTVNVNVNGTLIPESFTASADQTVFNITAFTYTPGTNSLLVFINGDKQGSGKDFAETSSTSFTLTEACLGGETVEVIGFPQITLESGAAALRADLLSTEVGKGTDLIKTKIKSVGAISRSVNSTLNDQRTIFDFDDELKAGGTSNASNAINKAIIAAMENGSGVGAGSGYMDIRIPVRTEGGLLLITEPIIIPGECLVRFVGEGGHYFQSGFLQGFAGDLFGCVSGNFTAQFHNIRFQGNKSSYPGVHSAIKTSQDVVHSALIGCTFRDFGGVSAEFQNVFASEFRNLVFYGNKTGAFRNTGGASNVFSMISTQVNNGFGLYIAGGGNSGGGFFLEGDLSDNDPSGLNLSNRSLKISGADNLFIGGTLLTSSLNDKTPVEFSSGAERSGWIGVAASSKGAATNWVTLGAGAKNCRLGGGLQTAITGDAAAIATCIGDISGPLQAMDNGEILFGFGSSASSGAKGTRVGFDSAASRGYIRSTNPGVSNLPLDLYGSVVSLRAPLGTDQSVAGTVLGAVVRKLAVTNESGAVLGYLPIYNSIT